MSKIKEDLNTNDVKNIPAKQANEISRHSLPFTVVIAFVVAFSVVSFWRGVWGLWDVLVFPDDKLLSSALSLLVGVVVLSVLRSFYSALAPPLPRINIHLKD